MDAQRTLTLPDLEKATASELEEALVHFEQLDVTSLERLAAHPVHGRKLDLLRAAEAWLEEASPEDLALDPCPAAEALYDFGKGPGFNPLASELELSVAAHLERCAECREVVTSLQSPPPLPLEVPEPSRSVPRVGSIPRPHRRPHRLVLLAAASLLLGVFVVPQLFQDPLDSLPQSPVYRGAQSEELLYPRGPLLERGDTSAASRFELIEVADAELYRVELYRHDGGAFAEGTRVEQLEGSIDELTLGALPAGRYTWKAWARVRGLEQALGARDFEVRVNSELADRLAALSEDASVAEIVEEIRALDAAGFVTDARTLARTLPESGERDAYLRPPGR